MTPEGRQQANAHGKLVTKSLHRWSLEDKNNAQTEEDAMGQYFAVV